MTQEDSFKVRWAQVTQFRTQIRMELSLSSFKKNVGSSLMINPIYQCGHRERLPLRLGSLGWVIEYLIQGAYQSN